MTPMQYADDLNAITCKVANFYEEETFNDIFINVVDRSICNSMRKYWATHPHANLTNIALKAQSLQAIQKGSVKAVLSGSHAAPSEPSTRRNRNKSSKNVVET